MEGGPAGGICVEEGGLGVGGVHFWVCGDGVGCLLNWKEIVGEGGSGGWGED